MSRGYSSAIANIAGRMSSFGRTSKASNKKIVKQILSLFLTFEEEKREKNIGPETETSSVACQDWIAQMTGLIMKYKGDVNATIFHDMKPVETYLKKANYHPWLPQEEHLTLSGLTLLHLACLNKCEDVVKLLVELGANVDLPTGTGGNVRLSPLQISIFLEDWENAVYLIRNGGNPNSEGCIDVKGFHFTEATRVLEKSDKSRSRTFTAMELVLRIGKNQSHHVLESMLEGGQDGGQSVGVSEFHVAVEGGDPRMVSMIFEIVSDGIAFNDLMWVNLRPCHEDDPTMPFPVFKHLLRTHPNSNKTVDLLGAANLLERLVDKGYNFNIEEQLFRILYFASEKDKKNVLLKKLLQMEHVDLNLRNWKGETPVEYVLGCFNYCCKPTWIDVDERRCKICSSWGIDTVRLLVVNGADVSNWMLSPKLTYHTGYNEMIKILYLAGTKITNEVFETQSICENESRAQARKALEELREWKSEKESEDRLSLQFKARIALRNSLRNIGDLKLLKRLPPPLRDQVLCTSI